MKNFLRVVLPPAVEKGGLQTSKGVKLYTANGEEVQGLVELKLETGVDAPTWRATITIDVNVSGATE